MTETWEEHGEESVEAKISDVSDMGDICNMCAPCMGRICMIHMCNLKRRMSDDERCETRDGGTQSAICGDARTVHYRQGYLSRSRGALDGGDFENDTLDFVMACKGKSMEAVAGTMRVAVRCVRSPVVDTLRNGPALGIGRVSGAKALFE